MVTHIVMFRLEGAPELIAAATHDFKAQIEALPGRIEGLDSAVVGINDGTDPGNWTLVLTARCTSYDTLATYARHPDHLACVAIIKPYLAGRVCVDYSDF